MALRVASIVVGDDAEGRGLHSHLPAERAQRIAVGVVDLPGPSGWSTSTSSLPVEMTATRGRRCTDT